MPHLRFRAIEEATVMEISETMADALGFALNTPAEYFTFEHVKTDFYFGGKPVKASPIIEVWWFDRSQEAQDLTAQMLHEAIVSKGYEETSIIFHKLLAESYYDNGQHY